MRICTLLLARVVFPLKQIPETEYGNMTKTTETMGMRIRARRKALGLSQENVADALNIKAAAVSQYESDKNDIAASRLSELVKVLDTSADYLLTGKEMGLDADEMELIAIFRELKGNTKEIAMQQIKVLQSFL